jgi:GNAT superfamily N-acetyltransferase
VIAYEHDASRFTAADVAPFFAGWPVRPSTERALSSLKGSDAVVLAWEGDRLVGFATAISDGAMFAYMPLVEVIEERRGAGVGTFLVRSLQERFEDLYGFDLCCDDEVVPYYERLGMTRVNGMVRRRPDALE